MLKDSISADPPDKRHLLVLNAPQLACMHHEVRSALEAGVIAGAQLRNGAVEWAVQVCWCCQQQRHWLNCWWLVRVK